MSVTGEYPDNPMARIAENTDLIGATLEDLHDTFIFVKLLSIFLLGLGLVHARRQNRFHDFSISHTGKPLQLAGFQGGET